jgi:hypothetical protein
MVPTDGKLSDAEEAVSVSKICNTANIHTGDDSSQDEPLLSLDWSLMSSSEIAYVPQDCFLGDGDCLMERPKTPLRQYLVEVIGEKSVQELEASENRGDETDDELRHEFEMMSETRIDSSSKNQRAGTGISKKKTKAMTGSNGEEKSSSLTTGSKKKTTAHVKRSKGRSANGPKHPKPRVSKMSHQDRLRFGIERIKESSTYWKEEEVNDPRLSGWCLHICKRANGNVDKYWFTPTGLKMRSKPQVEKFLEALKETNGDEDEAYILMSSGKRRALQNSRSSSTNLSNGKASSLEESAPPKEEVVVSLEASSDTASPRKSSRRKATLTTPSTDSGIDYSMTIAVQSASGSKRKDKMAKKKQRTTKHKLAASPTKESKRVKSVAHVAAVVPSRETNNMGNRTDESAMMKMRVSHLHVPYRLQQASITAEFAEPKVIEVKKAAKKKAAKGVPALSPMRKLDVPAVAERK